MRRIVIAAGLFVAATCAQAADCRGIANPDERLKCYDAENAPNSANATNYDILDFKVDKAKLVGKLVTLSGRITPIADDTLMLSADKVDLNPVWVETDKVGREERRKIAACSIDCRATITGIVAKIRMTGQVGIAAQSIKMGF